MLWNTQNEESWHAIYVITGQEEKVRTALEKHFGEQLKILIPTRELKERKAGKWHKVQRKLFPGYILIKGRVTVETYFEIKQLPMLTKLLKNEDGPQRIEEKELEVLNVLISSEDGNIGISTAFKENEKVQITSGPLVGLEGHIQSVDARKGRAKVKLDFLGETRIVQLGIDFVDKI